jgi:WD40 repeat protein
LPIPLAFHPDGSRLVTATIGDGRRIVLWDVKSGIEKVITQADAVDSQIEVLLITPDGKQVLTGDWGGKVRLWDLERQEFVRSFSVDDSAVMSLSLLPDGNGVITGGKDKGVVRLTNIRTGAQRDLTPPRPECYPEHLVVTADGRFAVWGSEERMCVFDLETERIVKTIEFKGELGSLQLLPEGQRVLSSHWPGVLRVWSIPEGTLSHEIDTGGLGRECAPLGQDAKHVVTWGSGRIQVWDLATGNLVTPFRDEHYGKIHAIDVAPDSRLIASSSDDGTIRIWDRDGTKPRHVLARSALSNGSLTYLPCANRLLAVDLKGHAVHVWDVTKGKLLSSISVPALTATSSSLAAPPKGIVLTGGGTRAVVGCGRSLAVLDVKEGLLIREVEAPIEGALQTIEGLAGDSLDPDLVHAFWDDAVGVFDSRLAAWRSVYPLNWVGGIAVVHNSAQILVKTKEGLTALNTRTGRLRPVHEDRQWWSWWSMNLMRPSPHGTRIAIATYGVSVPNQGGFVVWDLRSKRKLLEFSGHNDRVTGMSWIGEHELVTSSADLTLLVWDVRLRPCASASNEAQGMLALPDGARTTRIEELVDKVLESGPVRDRSIETLVALGDGAVSYVEQAARRWLAMGEDPALRFSLAYQQLTDDVPDRRRQAADAIRKCFPWSIPLVRRAFDSTSDVELRHQLQELVDESITCRPEGAALGLLIAIDVLEWIGTPRSKEALERLKSACKAGWGADAAGEALQRLSERGETKE